MALTSGTKLGPYEIQSALGAGGMGEVYRARDTRLDRTVAIKVLNSAVTASSDAKARFEREARAISQLNHPHICTLHDIGHDNGTDFLVMEYLEGETLAERLRRGLLPLDQVLKIGIEIANALDRAHRADIVHRDLKPSNIMLTKSGAKLLDFGLAKPAGLSAAAGMAPNAPLLTAAITMTSTSPQLSPLTTQGTIVGTIQYMSPEQIEGKEADARSDIFAFGSVLYEMASGKRAFQGKSQLSVATAILERDANAVSTWQKSAPPALDHVVAFCLAKDPEQRWQNAADVARELQWIAQAPTQAAQAVLPDRRRARWWMIAWALLLLIGGLGGGRALFRSPKAVILRLQLVLPEKYAFGYGLAISPDGSQVCFVADDEQNHSLLACRALNSDQLRFLSGTDDARFPFFSPDGSKLGFFGNEKLKTVDLASGFVQVLGDSSDPRGGAWGADNQIIFTPDPSSPLYRIPSTGGAAVPITKLEHSSSHRWPYFLPDGRHFLYFSRTASGAAESKIFVATLGSSEARELMSASSGVSAVPGYVVAIHGTTLFAMRFDENKLQIEGDPIPLAEGIEPEGEAGPTAYAPFALSQNGLLIYRQRVNLQTQLAWFDRTGKRLQDVTAEGAFDQPALSPDGTRLIVDRSDGDVSTHGVWMIDLARGTVNRFSLSTKGAFGGIWSPDGKEIIFAAAAQDDQGLYRRPSNATGPEELIPVTSRAPQPDSLSPDGRYLLYEAQATRNFRQLWLLPKFGDRKPFPFLPEAAFDRSHGVFSPDGRWIAYSSNESGRSEIYVQSFPDPRSKIQISTDGGDQASWSHDGKELFYFAPDRSIVSISVDARGDFNAQKPKALFTAPMRRYASLTDSRISYAVSPDGKRILVNARSQRTAFAPLSVVVNWTAELQK